MGHFPRRWLFPERDARGQIIGIGTRDPEGEKKQLTGSRRGLVYDPDRPFEGIVLVPEGASDVAAALSLGLTAIGRPNNCGGADLLADLLRPALQNGATVVLLAENDRNEDGRWPGKDGAETVARRLKVSWGIETPIVYPPDGFKDLRSWLLAHKSDGQDLGQRFLEQLGPLPETRSRSYFEQPFTLGKAAREVLRRGKMNRLCPQHFTPHLELRDNASFQKTLGVRCRNYACTSCGPRRRCCWLLHLARLFEAHLGDLYQVNVPPGTSLKTICRRIQRAHSEFVAVKTSTGPTVVISTFVANSIRGKIREERVERVEHGEEQTALYRVSDKANSCTDGKVSPSIAIESIAQALLALSSHRQPITTSRAWKLNDPTQTSGRWQRKGSAPEGMIDVVEDQLWADGLIIQSSEHDYGRQVHWQTPVDWTNEQRDAYRENLGFPFHDLDI
jgi:hypothetical protein